MSYNRYKNTQKRKNYLLIHNKEKYDRVSIILPKRTKEKIKRGCEKMSNHFIHSLFILYSYKFMCKKGYTSPYPINQ